MWGVGSGGFTEDEVSHPTCFGRQRRSLKARGVPRKKLEVGRGLSQEWSLLSPPLLGAHPTPMTQGTVCHPASGAHAHSSSFRPGGHKFYIENISDPLPPAPPPKDVAGYTRCFPRQGTHIWVIFSFRIRMPGPKGMIT